MKSQTTDRLTTFFNAPSGREAVSALRCLGVVLTCLCLANPAWAQELGDYGAPQDPAEYESPADQEEDEILLDSGAEEPRPSQEDTGSQTVPADAEPLLNPVENATALDQAVSEFSLDPSVYELTPTGSAYVTPPDPVGDYLYAIELMETEGGSYSSELADLYLSLGKTLLDSQSFEEAKNALYQAVHLVRVNYGPNSAEQNSYLYTIADIEDRLGDWKAAVNVLDTVYMVNVKAYGEFHPNMLPVLEHLYEWYQLRRPLDSPYVVYSDFENIELLTGRIAIITEMDKGMGHPDSAAIYRRIGQLHFRAAQYILSKGISVEPGIILNTGRTSASNINVQIVSPHYHFINGRDAFKAYVTSVSETENRTELEYAEAMAQFGDYLLMYEKNQVGRHMYELGYQVLAEGEGSKEAADDYFGTPAPFRFLKAEGEPTTSSEERGTLQTVDVSMTVTNNGVIRKVEVLDPLADITKQLQQYIKRQLTHTRFRPRIDNGVAVKMEDFVYRLAIAESGKIRWKPSD